MKLITDYYQLDADKLVDDITDMDRYHLLQALFKKMKQRNVDISTVFFELKNAGWTEKELFILRQTEWPKINIVPYQIVELFRNLNYPTQRKIMVALLEMVPASGAELHNVLVDSGIKGEILYRVGVALQETFHTYNEENT